MHCVVISTWNVRTNLNSVILRAAYATRGKDLLTHTGPSGAGQPVPPTVSPSIRKVGWPTPTGTL